MAHTTLQLLITAPHRYWDGLEFDLDGDGNPDITFDVGDILVVEAHGLDDHNDWCYGYVKTDESQRGVFPNGHIGPVRTSEAVTLSCQSADKMVTAEMPMPGSFYHVKIPRGKKGYGVSFMMATGEPVVVGIGCVPRKCSAAVWLSRSVFPTWCDDLWLPAELCARASSCSAKEDPNPPAKSGVKLGRSAQPTSPWAAPRGPTLHAGRRRSS